MHAQLRTWSKSRETHTQEQLSQEGSQNLHYHVEMVNDFLSPPNLSHTGALSVTEPNQMQEAWLEEEGNKGKS